MNILQICSKSPYPSLDGHTVAMNNVLQGLLRKNHKVKVLAVSTPKHKINNEDIPNKFKQKSGIETVFIDTSIKPKDVFLNLFTSDSYNIKRFYSEEFENKLIEILKNNSFDIIQFETVYVGQYINVVRKYSNAKTVLRAHNIEHYIWHRRAAVEKNPIKKRYLNLLARRLRNFEFDLFKRFDGIAAISSEDEKYLNYIGCNIPIVCIPVGFDFPENMNAEVEFPSLFYIGSMDWMPNIDGLLWFLKNVWERILERYPDLKFYVAGRKIDNYKHLLKFPNVIIAGEVESSIDFISTKSIMVSPIFYGSGIRVKIIEAMGLGKAVITSSIGAEGIPYQNLYDIIIADTADEFFSSIANCIENKNLTETISKNARKTALENFDNKNLTDKFLKFYKELTIKKF